MTRLVDLVECEDVRAGVETVLAQVVGEQRAAVESFSPDGLQLIDPLQEMLSRGKRMRAALCFWSWRAHGGELSSLGRQRTLEVGAALELFQAAALFHDDVMDLSSMRRGHPTAHVMFAAQHREAGWAGDADRFGTSVAILLGDLALVLAGSTFDTAVASLPLPDGRRARALFNSMQRLATVGQFLDVNAQVAPAGVDPEDDERRARAVVKAKAAYYSVAHPLMLGATLAGADADAVARTEKYGVPIGEAFQLRDDLLGVFGAPAQTGKPSGDDLREGKRTVLVARALAGSSSSDRMVLNGVLGRKDFDDAALGAARAILVRSGAVSAVEALISELAQQGLDGLTEDSLVEPGRSMLLALSRQLVEREA